MGRISKYDRFVVDLEFCGESDENKGMEFQTQFKNMPHSTRLTQLAQAEFEPIADLVLQETTWNVAFKAKKTSCEIEVFVRSSWGQFKAVAEAHDFVAALTAVSHRVEKQILKKKSRIQDHKSSAA